MRQRKGEGSPRYGFAPTSGVGSYWPEAATGASSCGVTSWRGDALIVMAGKES